MLSSPEDDLGTCFPRLHRWHLFVCNKRMGVGRRESGCNSNGNDWWRRQPCAVVHNPLGELPRGRTSANNTNALSLGTSPRTTSSCIPCSLLVRVHNAENLNGTLLEMYTLVHCHHARTVLDPQLVPGVVMRHVPGPWSGTAVSPLSGEGVPYYCCTKREKRLSSCTWKEKILRRTLVDSTSRTTMSAAV